MYTYEEHKEFLILVAKWAGAYESWVAEHPYEVNLVECNWTSVGMEYRVYVEGVGLDAGYSHMFSHQVTQDDINMYLFMEMDK